MNAHLERGHYESSLLLRPPIPQRHSTEQLTHKKHQTFKIIGKEKSTNHMLVGSKLRRRKKRRRVMNWKSPIWAPMAGLQEISRQHWNKRLGSRSVSSARQIREKRSWGYRRQIQLCRWSKVIHKGICQWSICSPPCNFCRHNQGRRFFSYTLIIPFLFCNMIKLSHTKIDYKRILSK